VIVVTGGANGLGRSIAIGAARHGARGVVVADLDEAPREEGTTSTSEVEKLGVPARFVRADVTSPEDNDAMMTAADELGGIDLMVANAGIVLPKDEGADMPAPAWRRLLGINLDGVFFGAQAAGRSMRAHGKGGSIVLMTSVMGFMSNSMSIAYSTSKSGLIGMMRGLASALGPDGIRVNAVAPGPVESPMLHTDPDFFAANEKLRERFLLNRYAQPEDIANAVAFYGSDLSSYITATTLPVDGGLTASL